MTVVEAVYEFATQQLRDEFIDQHYPDREIPGDGEVPGFYVLPDGRGLGVFCNRVTIYAREVRT